MTTTPTTSAASVFRALHDRPPLVLPNAWDAVSAAAIESAGATAIATTSAAISWACGVPDGERIGRGRMLQAVSEIVEAVAVPVTADVESGYAATPDDLGGTVKALLELGVAGLNLEDGPGTDTPLRDRSIQAARIAAVRAAADSAGVPLWINARTDTFLRGEGGPDRRLRETLERATVYKAAGADSLFVPGVTDLDLIRRLAAGPLPLNVMVGPGAPAVEELAAAGAARVSVGPAIAAAAYGLVARAAREILNDGTYTSMHDALDYGHLNDMFESR